MCLFLSCLSFGNCVLFVVCLVLICCSFVCLVIRLRLDKLHAKEHASDGRCLKTSVPLLDGSENPFIHSMFFSNVNDAVASLLDLDMV